MKRMTAAALAVLLLMAVPAGAVTLSWDANTETDLSHYTVYRRLPPADYGAGEPVGNVTTYEVGVLPPGEDWHFVVTATDTSGNESPRSNEVNTFPPAAPAHLSVAP